MMLLLLCLKHWRHWGCGSLRDTTTVPIDSLLPPAYLDWLFSAFAVGNQGRLDSQWMSTLQWLTETLFYNSSGKAALQGGIRLLQYTIAQEHTEITTLWSSTSVCCGCLMASEQDTNSFCLLTVHSVHTTSCVWCPHNGQCVLGK